MDREKASNEIMDLFIRVVNKYNGLEKIPVKHSPGIGLYHSERHMLDRVGAHPHMNITELARASGVTKGAISQIVKKLETKGVIRRYKRAANDKEVFIELTETGKKTCEERRRTNKETIVPLRDELDLYSDEHVAFLVHMFHWLDEFMDQTAKMMKSHGPAGE
ncbi:MAG: MarR family transcriptional regulator [Syntrophobacteraceae bacterium]|jgi:DNA-binding MarR family transcriptional regulator